MNHFLQKDLLIFFIKSYNGFRTCFRIKHSFLGYTYNEERNKSAIDSVKIESLIPSSPSTQNSTTPSAPEAPKLQLQCLRNKYRGDNYVRRSLFTNKRANGEIY